MLLFLIANVIVTDVTSADEDKLLHILQTVGCMSTKSAKRIYANIMHILENIKIVGIEYLRDYIRRLTEFINSLEWRIKENKELEDPNRHPDHNNEESKEESKEEKNSESPHLNGEPKERKNSESYRNLNGEQNNSKKDN